jgi:outer membrane receptor protein involved in Fe transport
MRVTVILITLLLHACILLRAQDSFIISGVVTEENDTPVAYANAALYQNDSTLVTGAVSDEKGEFKISATAGNYFLKITFLSFEERLIPGVNVSNNDISIGKVILKPASEILDAVTITGEKSQMELQLDKRVFRVGQDLSNISGSVTEILDNIPSIAVDVEGNISLRGSGNVRILIDGRPSGLTGINPADALRQLPAHLIESIEVITNPSARYDAEGEVGIINIILKKEKDKGLNGSFSLNAGYPDNYGAAFNLNFRRKNLNWFTSYGINYRSTPGQGVSTQRFRDFDNDSSFSFRQNSYRTRSGISHNIRAGADYFLRDNSMITGAFVVRLTDGLNKTENEYQYFDEDMMPANAVNRMEREDEPEINTEVALSYRKEYQRKGHVLTADFKWIENIETEKSQFEEKDLGLDSLTLQRSRNTENERNVLVQLDYVRPFNEKGKLELGFKSTLRVIDNDFKVEQQDQETFDWAILPSLNNNLIYRENIHAAYVIVGNEINKFGWQAGLRGELTDISAELTDTKQVNDQNYFNLFPSTHLSYKLAAEKTIQLSYSYRLSRPRFRDLMPFSSYSDNRNIPIGNPNLKPEYTHSLEAGYLLNWPSGSILSSVYYRYRTGVIEQITSPIPDSVGYTITMPVNLSTQDAYGFEFNFSFNPVKWWQLNMNANFYRAITEGNYNDEDFYADTYTWNTRTTSKFNIRKNWDFQIGFNYRAPRITPQGRDLSIYFIDLGLSRDILKGKGTITFAVRDLLNSRKFRSIIVREDYESEREFQWRARQFMFTFNYRLNSKKSKQDRENGDGDDGGSDF